MIIWSDTDLLVVNKPAGLLSTQDGYDQSLPTLQSTLQAEWGRTWLVHRLDKDTSGIILLARNPSAHRILNAAFQDRQIHKTYHAIILGTPPWIECTIDMPLRINGDRNHRTVRDTTNGKPAQTNVRLIQQFQAHSLIEARPVTGYTHQIRAHLSNLGFPLLGDPLYWKPGFPRPLTQPGCPIARTALHSWNIVFTHPHTGQTLSLAAPYPDDFVRFFDLFRPDENDRNCSGLG